MSLAHTDLDIGPSELVSIIGFPFGRVVDGKLPIWKTGHVASDIEINFNGKPVFLIDATTKKGMSGSPVVAKRKGQFITSSGGVCIGGQAVRFLGVYSGHIEKGAELGMVWKFSTINEILHSV